MHHKYEEIIRVLPTNTIYYFETCFLDTSLNKRNHIYIYIYIINKDHQTFLQKHKARQRPL